MQFKIGLFSYLYNQQDYIQQWIWFHYLAGIERFYFVIDEVGKEETLEKINELSVKDHIFCHFLYGEKQESRFIDAYNSLANRYKSEVEYFIFLKPNEYLYNPHKIDLRTIIECFDDFSCGGIVIPVTNFGHNGHIIKPKGLVIDDYVFTDIQSKEIVGLVKSSCFIKALDVVRPIVNGQYILENGIPYKSDISLVKSEMLRINRYKLSMEDLLAQDEIPNKSMEITSAFLDDTDNLFMNWDAKIYSKQIRDKLNIPIADATKDNTIFISHCDYPQPEKMCYWINQTAQKYGIDINWISWGDKFISWIDTKIYKVLRALEQIKDKKYAFVLDCRDVVFTAPLQEILDIFNLVYKGGVLFNADSQQITFPFINHDFMWKIMAAQGEKSIANAGVYGGEISTIIKYLRRLLCIRNQFISGNYTDYSVKVVSGLGKLEEDWFNDDQFMVQVSQLDEETPVRVDIEKRLFGMFGSPAETSTFPDLNNRQTIHKDLDSFIGTASILHCSHLSRDLDKWGEWVTKNILDK